jgi:integrase
MAGTVRHAKLESATSRARLRRGRQAHWRSLGSGSHLGYQRWPDDPEGRWMVRRRIDGSYQAQPLGPADDAREADGERVLSFDQAQAAAIAAVDAPKAKMARLTVRQAMEQYIEFKEAQGQPTRDLRLRSAAHILPPLGDKVVSELTTERLRRWLADLAASPAYRKGGRVLAPPTDDEAIRRRRATANRVLSSLKPALNFAFDEGHVTTSTAWGRKVKPFRAVWAARVRYLSVAEAQRLMNACDPPEFRTLVLGALQTGCRYGELTRLEVADFNPDVGTLTIRKSKTSKVRHVVLTDEGVAFFREITAGRSGTDIIFVQSGGRKWSTLYRNEMRDANRRANLSPPITFHGLRHSWASLSIMAGMPLVVVAQNLGHVDTTMCERFYGHLSKSFVADAVRAGAPRFGFKPSGTLGPVFS